MVGGGKVTLVTEGQSLGVDTCNVDSWR